SSLCRGIRRKSAKRLQMVYLPACQTDLLATYLSNGHFSLATKLPQRRRLCARMIISIWQVKVEFFGKAVSIFPCQDTAAAPRFNKHAMASDILGIDANLSLACFHIEKKGADQGQG